MTDTLFPAIFATGDRVRVKGAGLYERGIWRVAGMVATTEGDADPAYDVCNERTGRRRVFHGSRLMISR